MDMPTKRFYCNACLEAIAEITPEPELAHQRVPDRYGWDVVTRQDDGDLEPVPPAQGSNDE